MSSSVFTESNNNSVIKCNNDEVSNIVYGDDIGNTTATVADSNLVVLYGKNGINVDKNELEKLMDEKNVSTISVVRLSSSTENSKEENTKLRSNNSNNNDNNKEGNNDLLSTLEFSPKADNQEEEEEERELVGLTVEEFYPPEEAKKLAKEILDYADVSHPLELKINLEFQRLVIKNDHCYTPLTSPSQVKGAKKALNSTSAIEASSSSSSSSRLSTSSSSLNRTSLTKNQSITTTAQKKNSKISKRRSTETSNIEEKESEIDEEGEEGDSDYTESDFSSESDNDRDSDLDFDVNDRGKRKKSSVKKQRGRPSRKITKKRQSSTTDKEFMNNQDDEVKMSKTHRPSIETRRSQQMTTSAIIVSNVQNLKANTIKVYPASKSQARGIHIISQHPTPDIETQKELLEQQKAKIHEIHTGKDVNVNRSLLKNSTGLKKKEGVFTEISTFLKKGESSKPNLKVTQLKTGIQQISKIMSQPSKQIASTSKGFMPLGVEAAVKNQLPAQISIQTHQSSTELAAENDKQLDLIDSIVKDEMKKSSIIVKDTMNENIPQLVKMLENTEKVVLAKSKGLDISKISTTTVNQSPSSFTHHSVEDIDITSAPLLESTEDEIPEDILQHVVELMENKNIQDVIDKEILTTTNQTSSATTTNDSLQLLMDATLNNKSSLSSQNDLQNQLIDTIIGNDPELRNLPKKEPIEVIRKDGRVIKLPPIEAPTTRAKRRAQTQGIALNSSATKADVASSSMLKANVTKSQGSNSRRNSSATINEQRSNTRKRESISTLKDTEDEDDDESDDTESEDDPNKLWCICRQPHNNRFMICCDVCEDWFHGTCVNITKAMGIEMELKGIEWTCPKCLKKDDPQSKKTIQKRINEIFVKKSNEPESSNQQQINDTKKTSDVKKSQLSHIVHVTGDSVTSKKSEQNKKLETTGKKSTENIQKKLNDSKKMGIMESGQKKITDILKSAESATQRKTSVSNMKNVDIVHKKFSEQTLTRSTIEMQKKNEHTKLTKEDVLQKKLNQADPSSSIKTNDESLNLKATLEKQTIQMDSPKTKEDDRQSCIVCKKKARSNSIYCSDDCIRRHAQNARITVSKAAAASVSTILLPQADKKKKTPSSFEEALAKASETTLQIKNKVERVYVFERKTGRVLTGSNAPTTANLKKWLQDNPTYEVVQPGSSLLQAIEKNKQKQKAMANEQNVTKATVLNPTLPTLTTPKSQQKSTLQIDMQPLSYSTPKLKKTYSQTSIPKSLLETTKDKEDKEVKEINKDKKDTKKTLKKQSSNEQVKNHSSSTSNQSNSPVTTPTTTTTTNNNSNENDNVRSNVKRTIKECLLVRMNEMVDPEAPKLDEHEIDEFSNETENEMYKLFNNDVGAKYKSKYRSLMFNIRDKKNKTLYFKIFGKQIGPKQFVRMSPEDLASQELAQWRQNENKHQLEMIKKSELDLLSCKKNYVLKTHKGEEVIESKSTDQLSLDITIPVEDVVTVLNSSTVSSTSEEISASVTSLTQEKDKESSKISNLHESSFLDVTGNSSTVGIHSSLQESDMKEKSACIALPTSTTSEKKKTHKSSGSSSNSKDKERDRDRDRDRERHHKQKEKHRHKKRSRSRSRSRERKHRNQGHEEKRSRIEKDRINDSQKKEKYEHKEKPETKEKSSSKDRSNDNNKDKIVGTIMTTMPEKQESKSKQSTNNKLLTSNSSSQTSIKSKDKETKLDKNLDSENYNLIDKILESTKTVEEAANLVSVNDKGKDKEKETEKEKEKQQSSLKMFSSASKSKFNELSTNSTDSDQEPSSTVSIATPPEDQYIRYSNDTTSTIWSGSINMIDVATFQIVIQPVSGKSNDLENELPKELDVVGRIGPETVWEYIGKIKKSPNKEIVIIRLIPSCESENIAYSALYTYLDKRNRLGVVKTISPSLKDFYILPLGSGKMLPSVLLPVTNPDIFDDDARPDFLMGIVIRIMGKRSLITTATTVSKNFHPSAKIRKVADTSVITGHNTNLDDDNFTPPNSPKKKLESKSSSILTAGRLPPKIDDDSNEIDTIIASAKLNKPYNPDDEPYSPGGSSDDDNLGIITSLPNASSIIDSSTTPDDLQRQMDEINRQIEARKMEIAGMLNLDQGNNYSVPVPSVDLTPALANISIPSNLHQILASIKQTPSSTSVSSPLPTSSSSLITEPKILPPPPPCISSSSTISPSTPSSSSSSVLSSNKIQSIPSLSLVNSDTSNIPPPPLIGSILNTSSSSDELEEYVPGPITAKIPSTGITSHSLDANDDVMIQDTETGSFSHDVDLRIKYPQLSKKPRWDKIDNPPPPGLEDEYT